jgi:hypothetical protein
MDDTLRDTGLDRRALERYIEEQIYALPGTTRHREQFTILLTGGRAAGMFTPGSDVDIDVVCPREVCDAVLHAAQRARIIRGDRFFFGYLEGDDWQRYFGEGISRPHFSLVALHRVAQDFAEYRDVPLWIWTNARIITDPGDQFGRIVSTFRGYRREVLVPKIKYRWLLAAYADVDTYPHHHGSDDDLLPGATAILATVNELLRLFFLVEGEPFPYVEKLMPLAKKTALGSKFCPVLQRAVDLAVGKEASKQPAWQRLDQAIEMLLSSDVSPDAERLHQGCAAAMIAAGVDPAWVQADYDNIDELLSGELGPAP